MWEKNGTCLRNKNLGLLSKVDGKKDKDSVRFTFLMFLVFFNVILNFTKSKSDGNCLVLGNQTD